MFYICLDQLCGLIKCCVSHMESPKFLCWQQQGWVFMNITHRRYSWPTSREIHISSLHKIVMNYWSSLKWVSVMTEIHGDFIKTIINFSDQEETCISCHTSPFCYFPLTIIIFIVGHAQISMQNPFISFVQSTWFPLADEVVMNCLMLAASVLILC